MDPRHIQFIVTPWRNSQELFQLRHDLYGSDTAKKEDAVNKIFAWRLRKQDGLPLLLDSTADIVDVVLQDGKNELNHNALRLLYATALSRFITGLADTQTDLLRDKPSWFAPGQTLQLPLPLLELRHRIVHRHLPSLAELKRGAQSSLDWLWEWYWSQLDHAFGPLIDDEVEGVETMREKLQAILKTYVKDRKNEIKTRKQEHQAAETAIATYTLRYTPGHTSTSHRSQKLLLRLLIDEKMILPADKKLGSSMAGAFLIWDPLFLRIAPATTLLEHMFAVLNARTSPVPERDAVKEGLYEWVMHILTSEPWTSNRDAGTVESVLAACFCDPRFWNVKVAEKVLEDEGVRDSEAWRAVLRAAKQEERSGDEGMEDVQKEPVTLSNVA